MKQPAHGFTLIELLIVISIIAILATVGMIIYSTAQKNGRISKRVQDLKAMATALEVYHAANNTYPCSKNGGTGCISGGITTLSGSTSWGARSVCASWNPSSSIDNSNMIPNFTPAYMPVIPTDPAMNVSSSLNCYIYNSEGANYKLYDQNVIGGDMTASDLSKQPQLIDPAWYSGGSNPCSGNTGLSATPTNWAIYTVGSQCWQ